MDKDLHSSNDTLTDYELERIREELVLDGGRNDHADAPLPTGPSTEKGKGGLGDSKDAGPSVWRRKPLD